MKKFFNSLNLNALSGAGFQDFQTRQKLLTYFLAALLVLALFYWTSTILSSKKAEIQSTATAARERIVRVQSEIQKLQDKELNAKPLNTALPSYIQGMGQRMGMSAKFVNIRPVSSTGKQEQVSFRSENLVYKDFSAILQDFEQYDNVWVKSVQLAKRFDNPKRLDVIWDIVRTTQ